MSFGESFQVMMSVVMMSVAGTAHWGDCGNVTSWIRWSEKIVFSPEISLLFALDIFKKGNRNINELTGFFYILASEIFLYFLTVVPTHCPRNATELFLTDLPRTSSGGSSGCSCTVTKSFSRARNDPRTLHLSLVTVIAYGVVFRTWNHFISFILYALFLSLFLSILHSFSLSFFLQ